MVQLLLSVAVVVAVAIATAKSAVRPDAFGQRLSLTTAVRMHHAAVIVVAVSGALAVMLTMDAFGGDLLGGDPVTLTGGHLAQYGFVALLWAALTAPWSAVAHTAVTAWPESGFTAITTAVVWLSTTAVTITMASLVSA